MRGLKNSVCNPKIPLLFIASTVSEKTDEPKGGPSSRRRRLEAMSIQISFNWFTTLFQTLNAGAEC